MSSPDGEYAAEPDLAAAMRYIMTRYGMRSVAEFRASWYGDYAVPGRYASGGIIPRPGGGNGGNQPPAHGGSGSTNTIHFTGGGGSLSGAGGASGGSGIVSGGGGYPGEFPEPEPEPAVAPGSVTGYRWWTLPAPDWLADPGAAGRNWPPGLLHGVQDHWRPGVNTAACRSGYGRSYDHPVPARGCGCGFWAYWQPEHRDMTRGGMGVIPVFGAVKAWGRVRLASHGFRAEKARILAVHLPFTLLPAPAAGLQAGWGDAHPRPGHVTRALRDGRKLLLPAGVSQDEAQAAADHAEAWMAVVGDRLETSYRVRVFETREALLACFPPDPEGLRRMSVPHCPVCGGNPVLGPEGHDRFCPNFFR